MDTKIEIVGSELQVYIGIWKAVSFEVKDRFNYDGHRRNRNTAIYVATGDINPKWNRALTESMYVKNALSFMKQLSIDPQGSGFIDLLKKRGWVEEIPSEYLPGQTLPLF